MSSAATTTRARRPRDRKQQIIRAAADLFHRHGYANVGTGQIADSVGITAGALYRHFRGKQDLLAEALGDVFDRSLALVADAPPMDLETMVSELAATATRRPDLGVLWSRESRHLDGDRLEQVRRRFFRFLAGFATAIRVRRPDLSAEDADLLAFSALAVLTSVSYHRTRLSNSATTDLLQHAAVQVLTTPMDAPDAPGPGVSPSRPIGLEPHSRREAILAAATSLFHQRGFQSVTMDEIGAVVKISSTAVYKYFPSKSDLLSAVVARAAEPLQLGLSRALSGASTSEEGLHAALDAYVDFGLDHHDLVGILVSEVTNLPDSLRHDVRRSQHDYVEEWVRLLTDARPELDASRAKYVVHAVLTVVNDVIRTEHLRNRPTVSRELRLVGRRLLSVEV